MRGFVRRMKPLESRGTAVRNSQRYIWVVPADLLPSLDRLLETEDPAASLDFLIEQFLTAKEYALVFEARLMRKRFELGLPLVQTDSVTRDDYQQAVVEAAREAGQLFLAAGNIERAWPYFRAISEPGPVADAIAGVPPAQDSGETNLDPVISIAFQEGVHPRHHFIRHVCGAERSREVHCAAGGKSS